MSRYTVSRPAREDLTEVYCYIAQNNPAAAGRLRDIFHDKFRMLARNPLLGELRLELGPDIRAITVGRYVVFYRLSGKSVSIVRVIHSARDLEKAWRSG